MNRDQSVPQANREPRHSSDFIGSYGLAYVLCIALIGVPIYLAGLWKIIANTRFLDLLMSAGIIAYTDVDQGFVRGIPDLSDYLKSQDPIDGRLVLICFCIYLGFYLVKAVQFHSICRMYGLQGSFEQHARAFYYGMGLNRLLPFHTGDVGIVSALERQGESPHGASSALYVQDLFVCFEIAFFLVIGLVLTGWKATFAQTLPAVIFFGILYFLVGWARSRRTIEAEHGARRGSFQVLRVLANDPFLLMKLGLLSLLAFFLDDITPYVTSQAFTSTYVHLNVPFLIIQAGVVSGYIASRIPITPGGIGQFEFGFGAALVMGGVALPEAITIAILDGLIRHATALVLFLMVKFRGGVATDIGSVLHRFITRPATVLTPRDSMGGRT